MKPMQPKQWTEFEEDCHHWRGRLLTGARAHWCPEWDDLPIDETCPEWPCGCAVSSDEGWIKPDGTVERDTFRAEDLSF